MNRTEELENFFNSIEGVETEKNHNYPFIGCLWVYFSGMKYKELCLFLERENLVTVESYTINCKANVFCSDERSMSDSHEAWEISNKIAQAFKNFC